MESGRPHWPLSNPEDTQGPKETLRAENSGNETPSKKLKTSDHNDRVDDNASSSPQHGGSEPVNKMTRTLSRQEKVDESSERETKREKMEEGGSKVTETQADSFCYSVDDNRTQETVQRDVDSVTTQSAESHTAGRAGCEVTDTVAEYNLVPGPGTSQPGHSTRLHSQSQSTALEHNDTQDTQSSTAGDDWMHTVDSHEEAAVTSAQHHETADLVRRQCDDSETTAMATVELDTSEDSKLERKWEAETMEKQGQKVETVSAEETERSESYEKLGMSAQSEHGQLTEESGAHHICSRDKSLDEMHQETNEGGVVKRSSSSDLLESQTEETARCDRQMLVQQDDQGKTRQSSSMKSSVQKESSKRAVRQHSSHSSSSSTQQSPGGSTLSRLSEHMMPGEAQFSVSSSSSWGDRERVFDSVRGKYVSKVRDRPTVVVHKDNTSSVSAPVNEAESECDSAVPDLQGRAPIGSIEELDDYDNDSDSSFSQDYNVSVYSVEPVQSNERGVDQNVRDAATACETEQLYACDNDADGAVARPNTGHSESADMIEEPKFILANRPAVQDDEHSPPGSHSPQPQQPQPATHPVSTSEILASSTHGRGPSASLEDGISIRSGVHQAAVQQPCRDRTSNTTTSSSSSGSFSNLQFSIPDQQTAVLSASLELGFGAVSFSAAKGSWGEADCEVVGRKEEGTHPQKQGRSPGTAGTVVHTDLHTTDSTIGNREEHGPLSSADIFAQDMDDIKQEGEKLETAGECNDISQSTQHNMESVQQVIDSSESDSESDSGSSREVEFHSDRSLDDSFEDGMEPGDIIGEMKQVEADITATVTESVKVATGPAAAGEKPYADKSAGDQQPPGGITDSGSSAKTAQKAVYGADLDVSVLERDAAQNKGELEGQQGSRQGDRKGEGLAEGEEESTTEYCDQDVVKAVKTLTQVGSVQCTVLDGHMGCFHTTLCHLLPHVIIDPFIFMCFSFQNADNHC